jgi:hypothetical protein
VGLHASRGELLKLGVKVSATTIATLLRRNALDPAPSANVRRRDVLDGPTTSTASRRELHGSLKVSVSELNRHQWAPQRAANEGDPTLL